MMPRRNVIILNKINETLALFSQVQIVTRLAAYAGSPSLLERSNSSTDQFSLNRCSKLLRVFAKFTIQPNSSLQCQAQTFFPYGLVLFARKMIEHKENNIFYILLSHAKNLAFDLKYHIKKTRLRSKNFLKLLITRKDCSCNT
jgi:hypothetical protein